MNDTQTTPAYPADAVAEALHLIATGSVPCIDLEPGDALFQVVPDVVHKPIAWLAGQQVGYESGTWQHRVLVLNREGRQVPIPNDDVWFAEIARLHISTATHWRHTPNSAIRVGDLLVISLGEMFPAAEVEVDGERVVELVTLAEAKRRNEATKAGWLNEHPDVVALRPEWAETMAVEDLDGAEGVNLYFERLVGALRLVKYATYADGTLHWDDGSDAPTVQLESAVLEDLSLDDMLTLVDSLMMAIPIVRDAAAHEAH